MPEEEPSAPAAAVEAAASSTDVVADAPASPETPSRVSFEEAVAQARTATEATESTSTDAGSEGGSEEPPSGEAAQDSQTEPSAADRRTPETRTTQGVLQRIHDLVEQGRESELNQVEQGILRRIRSNAVTRYETEQTQEREFKGMYLDLLTKQSEDPEAFARYLVDDPNGPRTARFMQSYKAAHPEVSLDDPDATPAIRPDSIRREERARFEQALNDTLDIVGAEAGVDVAKLREGSDGLGSLLRSVIADGAKALAEKDREAIRKAERKAAEQEATAKWAPKTIVTPKMVNGQVPRPGKAGPKSRLSFEEAAALAREEVAV